MGERCGAGGAEGAARCCGRSRQEAGWNANVCKFARVSNLGLSHCGRERNAAAAAGSKGWLCWVASVILRLKYGAAFGKRGRTVAMPAVPIGSCGREGLPLYLRDFR